MVDQITTSQSCSVCGATLSNDELELKALCRRCAGYDLARPPIEAATDVLATQLPDADHPHWGPGAGIGVWLASVAAIIVVPVLAVIAWYLFQKARHAPVPSLSARDELLDWLKSPNLLLLQVLSTILAHAITIAVCWAVVTRVGTRPFWESLGWSWAGRSVWYWVVFSACIIVGLIIVDQALVRILPQSEENSFAELIKSSQRVRIAIAVLATFTAPIVEETVYRGVLFASVRRHLGLIATVVLITLLFAGVHVLQYWGAWVSVAGLTLLSLALTVIRARTKSILPCVVVHTLNNAFFSVLILLNKAS
jgi:membrane protease YdiL (CAAX protease family)